MEDRVLCGARVGTFIMEDKRKEINEKKNKFASVKGAEWAGGCEEGASAALD